MVSYPPPTWDSYDCVNALVAAVSPFDCPLMLGDILITGPPDPRTRAMLPTIGNCHLVDDRVVDLSRVAWLASKVCVINDSLAVGWAGSYEPAKRIISAMRAFPWSSEVTLQDVQKCLATTDYDDQAAVSLVGLFLHAKGIGEFGLNATKINLPLFNRSRIIGSGKASFLEMARNIGGVHTQGSSSGDPSWPQAVAITLASSAAFMGEEMRHYGGLNNHFGGSFEVLVFQEQKLIKLDDLLYCFWQVREHSENGITLSPHKTFIKIKYYQDILKIRRADFADQRQMRNDDFMIGPMAKEVDANELHSIRELDLNAVHDCHYVAVPSGDGCEVFALVNFWRRCYGTLREAG
jgi:hypothetical protein